MGKHTVKSCSYFTVFGRLRVKNELNKWRQLYESDNELCKTYGISRSTLFNWLRGESEMKASFARYVEHKTGGQIKARNLLGV